MTETLASLLRRDGAKIGGIVLVALVLRLPYVGWGLPSETHDLNSYHPDENGVLRALSNMDPSNWDFDTKTYYWGTAYFYLCGAVFKVLQITGLLELVSDKGYYLDHLDELDRLYLAGRIFSLSVALLSVPLIYYVGTRISNRTAGLWSAALLATLPVHADRSALMLSDGTGAFFLLLALGFFFGAATPKQYLAAGLFFGLACASKYHFGLTGVYFVCYLVKPWQWRRSLWFGLGAVTGFMVGCPYLVPNLPTLLEWLGSAAHNVSSGHVAIFGEYRSALLCVLNMFAFAGGAFFLTAVAIAIHVLARWQKDRLWLVLPFALFTVLMTLSQTRLSHYFLPAVPFAILLVADWCVPRAERGRAVLWAVVILGFLQSWSFAELVWRKDTRTRLSDYLVQHLPRDTRIGVTHNRYFYTPPILMEKESYYHVEVYGDNFRAYNLAKLQAQKPSCFVLSEFEWREPTQHPDRAPDRKEFLDYVMLSGEYLLATEIQTSPSILGLKLPRMVPPWNERAFYPTMRLYRQKMPSPGIPGDEN